MKMIHTIFILCLVLSACGKDEDDSLSNENEAIISAQEEITAEGNRELDTSGNLQIKQPSNEEMDLNTTKEADLLKENDADVLEIREKMFLTQINDIYCNFDAYKDKTIIVEGVYGLLYSWDGSERIPGVYRRGPGCCGNDGWGGFFLKYDGALPNENDWIRVTGTPELERGNGFINLHLHVTSIEVKGERGAEFVMQ